MNTLECSQVPKQGTLGIQTLLKLKHCILCTSFRNKRTIKTSIGVRAKRLSVFDEPSHFSFKPVNQTKKTRLKKYNKSMSGSGAINMFNIPNSKYTINEKTQEDEEVKSSYKTKSISKIK